MAKKEHRVKVKVHTLDLDGYRVVEVVNKFQEILKGYPDAWIDYDYYGYEGGFNIEVFATREETAKEREAKLALAKKEKEVQEAKELELLAKLKAKYEKETKL